MKASMEAGRGAARGRGMETLLAAAFLAGSGTALAEAGLEISGFAWSQYQNGLTSMYKGAANFDYNPFFSAGGLMFLESNPNERWNTRLGLGVAYGNTAIVKSLWGDAPDPITKTNPHSISLGMSPFLHEARVSYTREKLAFMVGKFHYTYGEHNTNLGLYLLRGPVYPGFLYSGFEDIGGLTRTGALFSWRPDGKFRWDVIPAFETSFKPYMDLNLSSFITFKTGLLELGAGVESQRLVEFNPCVTSPRNERDLRACLGGDPGNSYVGPGADLYAGAFFVIDTNTRAATGKSDTTTFSLAGTKVMARGALDLKRVIPPYRGSRRDLTLYFEAALLGVKDYKHIYADKAERIPVLVGFNVPTFGLLDLLSVEAEYYNAPFQNDPYKLVGAYDVFQFSDGNSINYAMSPIPPSAKAGKPGIAKATEDYDPSKDNLKWSIYAAKQLHQRITVKAQVASDHWRVPNNNFVQYEAFAEPSQFYGSLRVDYAL